MSHDVVDNQSVKLRGVQVAPLEAGLRACSIWR